MASSVVASPSSATASPPPPLSYAERARKAQNIRSPIAVSHDPGPASPDLPTSAAGTHPKSPIANVWSQRMAAVRATAPSTLPAAVSAPTTGPSAAPESADFDPFVVRTNINAARQPPPAMDDKTWPEVGRPLQDEIAPNHDPVVPGPSPRKSEKTKSKWVPIPRQELQAAADALDNRRRKSSRHHSHSGSRKPPSKTFAQGSAPGSATHSRIHSASQSRSESLQSSPLFPRGRRLPDDKDVLQNFNSQSRPRSPPPRFSTTSMSSSSHQHPHPSSSIHPSTSRPHSPPLVVHPHLAPLPQPIPVYTQPDPNPFLMRYGPGGTPLPYPTSPPPGTYPVFPYPPPLHQPAWYPNLGAMQHWSSNTNTSQPGSGQHSPRYPNPNVYQMHQIPRQPHHERINSRATGMTKQDSACTERQDTSHPGPLPPAVSLPVTVSASTPVHVDGPGGMQQAPTFGTIGTDRSPSPVPDSKPMDEDGPKPFPQFTIGVAPGEIVTTRSRSRAHSQTSSHSGKRSRTVTGDEKLGLAEVSEKGEEKEGEKVIDLTGGNAASETRWAFGTVATGQGETLPQVDAALLSPVSMSPSHATMNVGEHTDAGEAIKDQSPSESSPSELQKRLEQLVMKGGEDGHNPFEVKDYGYGFGSRGSSGGSPQTQSQMEQQKHNEGGHTSPAWERERGDYVPRHSKREISSRRGGGYHNHNYHSHPNHGQGAGHEGRGYPPRRGRGNNHGNGHGRGGYPHRRNGSGYQQHLNMRPPPPFGVTPQFDPGIAAGGFPAGRPMMGMGMNGIGMNGMYNYDGPGYAPIPMPQPAPVPAPMTQVSFPLDTTRWYLLGQLEYYLSAQNMAQDYFLRQRLDSKGWVPISLIASFNRVRQLTEDEALVREVLTLSSVVEVQGAWVRMKDWRAFVLPGARPSSVHENEVKHLTAWNGDQDGAAYVGKDEPEKVREEQGDANAGLDGDVDEDDEDEDDVVFVLTRD